MARFIVGILIVAAVAGARAQNYTAEDAKAVAQSYTAEGKGDYDAALAVMNSRGDKSSDYFFQLRLGWLNYAKGGYQTAEAFYDRAAELQPMSVDARVGQMNCSYLLKDYHRTAASAESMLKDDPGNYYGRLYQILAEMAAKNYGSAELHAKDATALFPIDLKINLNLAYTYIFQGRKDDAHGIANMLTTIYGGSNKDVLGLLHMLK